MEVVRTYIPATAFKKVFTTRDLEPHIFRLKDGWDPSRPAVVHAMMGAGMEIVQGTHRSLATAKAYPDRYIPTLMVYDATSEDIRGLCEATEKPMDWHFPPSP